IDDGLTVARSVISKGTGKAKPCSSRPELKQRRTPFSSTQHIAHPERPRELHTGTSLVVPAFPGAVAYSANHPLPQDPRDPQTPRAIVCDRVKQGRAGVIIRRSGRNRCRIRSVVALTHFPGAHQKAISSYIYTCTWKISGFGAYFSHSRLIK